jgi:hypothetical protein
VLFLIIGVEGGIMEGTGTGSMGDQNQGMGIKTQTLNFEQKVIVTDIHMPFGSMVMFMIKWAIASIPAAIILFIIGSLVLAFIGGFVKPGNPREGSQKTNFSQRHHIAVQPQNI